MSEGDCYEDYDSGDYFDDEPEFDCDNPYKDDEQEIEEDSDDYLRDSLGNVVKYGTGKVKQGDVNFAFSKRYK